MTPLTKISGNSLNELRNLMGDISRLIERDYLHVNEHLSKPFMSALNAENKTIEAEYHKRQNRL